MITAFFGFMSIISSLVALYLFHKKKLAWMLYWIIICAWCLAYLIGKAIETDWALPIK